MTRRLFTMRASLPTTRLANLCLKSYSTSCASRKRIRRRWGWCASSTLELSTWRFTTRTTLPTSPSLPLTCKRALLTDSQSSHLLLRTASSALSATSSRVATLPATTRTSGQRYSRQTPSRHLRRLGWTMKRGCVRLVVVFVTLSLLSGAARPQQRSTAPSAARIPTPSLSCATVACSELRGADPRQPSQKICGRATCAEQRHGEWSVRNKRREQHALMTR
mmetsp:Transcript_83011/g.165736  ORF Transcript_83011/g.165736 Transcript_83011/m.165736 type:complete len:221 (-) Transcript_83011:236-898(-)